MAHEERLALTDPYAWPCPHCGAIVGQGCTNPKNGNWLALPHELRKACASAQNARGVAQAVKEMTEDADLGRSMFHVASFLASALLAAGIYYAARGEILAQVPVGLLMLWLWGEKYRQVALVMKERYDAQVLDVVRRIRTHMELEDHQLQAVEEIFGDETGKELI